MVARAGNASGRSVVKGNVLLPHTLSNPTCLASYALTRTRASGKLTSGRRAARQALSSSRASRLGMSRWGRCGSPRDTVAITFLPFAPVRPQASGKKSG